MVMERLVKYRAEPFIGNRGEHHKLGRLNHSSTMVRGCLEEWA